MRIPLLLAALFALAIAVAACTTDVPLPATGPGVTIATPQVTAGAKPVVPKPAPTVIVPTEILTYAAAAPTGGAKDGQCWTGSLAVWRDNAWRCSAGNQVYDPCFTLQQGKSVVCGGNPTGDGSTFTLNLTKPLPTANVPQDRGTHAWQLKLADGSVCTYDTGATTAIEGKRLNYLCTGGTPDQPARILGDPQPGLVWRVQKVTVATGANGPEAKQSAVVEVVTAWR